LNEGFSTGVGRVDLCVVTGKLKCERVKYGALLERRSPLVAFCASRMFHVVAEEKKWS
jgi:hypothetical protein